jgi:hypothetical protein
LVSNPLNTFLFRITIKARVPAANFSLLEPIAQRLLYPSSITAECL